MCGIVGIFDLKGQREIDRNLLVEMNELQFHRGPDEGGTHFEPGVGFGHRRLSIIDLSSGQQPLFNEDGTVVVTYNGEIYNFHELAIELKEKGHIFKTHCDTEVIVHAWEEWGEKCVERFRGMFAFAVWDRNQKTMFIGRDRLGIKPLYYAELDDGYFIFASELKALLKHPGLKREMDYYALEDYVALGYVPEPRTIIKSARKLLPGFTLTLKFGQAVPSPKQYWDVPFKSSAVSNEKEIQESLIERLTDAVNIRLVAEVPLGAFLSGGVDSSAIVALMAGISPDKAVNTCSISFGDPKYNESEFAQLVADKFSTDHFVEQVDPEDFDLLDKLAGYYDEPFADSSAMPTYRVCELAKKKVTVALSGDGGDENFAGYRRHRWHMNEEKVRSMFPLWMRSTVFGALGTAYPKMDWAPKIFRAKSTFQALARNSVDAYLHSVSVTTDEQRQRLYSAKTKSELQSYHAREVFHHYLKQCPTEHPLSQIQYIDMKTYLVGDILTKVDRASMAHALEVRVPILDHKFVEWASGIDPALHLNNNEGKFIFKKSLESRLPNDILYRPKMGFAVPLANWFRGPLKKKLRTALLDSSLAESGLFEQSYVKKLVDEHQSGMREHSAALWALLMFEASYRQVFNS